MSVFVARRAVEVKQPRTAGEGIPLRDRSPGLCTFGAHELATSMVTSAPISIATQSPLASS